MATSQVNGSRLPILNFGALAPIAAKILLAQRSEADRLQRKAG